MKMNNKGFSMVELIIVIAIMAILVGAIAPTLIKYVNKSRMSSDASNAQTLASAMQEAYAEEGAAENVSSGASLTVTVDAAGALTFNNDANDSFKTAFKEIVGNNGPKKKYKKNGRDGFTATLKTATNECYVTDKANTTLYPTNSYETLKE